MTKTSCKMPSMTLKTVVYRAERTVTEQDLKKVEKLLKQGWAVSGGGFYGAVMLYKHEEN